VAARLCRKQHHAFLERFFDVKDDQQALIKAAAGSAGDPTWSFCSNTPKAQASQYKGGLGAAGKSFRPCRDRRSDKFVSADFKPAEYASANR